MVCLQAGRCMNFPVPRAYLYRYIAELIEDPECLQPDRYLRKF